MLMIHCGGDGWDESIEMGMWSIADFLPVSKPLITETNIQISYFYSVRSSKYSFWAIIKLSSSINNLMR